MTHINCNRQIYKLGLFKLQLIPDKETLLTYWSASLFGFRVVLESLEMKGHGEEQHTTAYEIGVVIPKKNIAKQRNAECDCVEVLVNEFEEAGFIVNRVFGLHDQFIKVQHGFYLSPWLLKDIIN